MNVVNVLFGFCIGCVIGCLLEHREYGAVALAIMAFVLRYLGVNK